MTKVWVVVLNHMHGTETSVFSTEEKARASVIAYVREFWDQEMGDALLPENDQEAIDKYFEETGDDYFIDCDTVDAND